VRLAWLGPSDMLFGGTTLPLTLTLKTPSSRATYPIRLRVPGFKVKSFVVRQGLAVLASLLSIGLWRDLGSSA
jgi:hypothetical protein